MSQIENFPGWRAWPSRGRSPFKVIDDPEVIARKNKMRMALREEYIKRVFNPYRLAAGMGGTPFDPAIIRYNAMMRTQTQFFRLGPKVLITSFFYLVLPFSLIVYFNERDRKNRCYQFRTGQVAYKDRSGRQVL